MRGGGVGAAGYCVRRMSPGTGKVSRPPPGMLCMLVVQLSDEPEDRPAGETTHAPAQRSSAVPSDHRVFTPPLPPPPPPLSSPSQTVAAYLCNISYHIHMKCLHSTYPQILPGGGQLLCVQRPLDSQRHGVGEDEPRADGRQYPVHRVLLPQHVPERSAGGHHSVASSVNANNKNKQ